MSQENVPHLSNFSLCDASFEPDRPRFESLHLSDSRSEDVFALALMSNGRSARLAIPLRSQSHQILTAPLHSRGRVREFFPSPGWAPS